MTEEVALVVAPPYRLDLTVAVLRRFSTNAVDVMTPGGAYVRALPRPDATPLIVAVRQSDATTLAVTFEGARVDLRPDIQLVQRILGTEMSVARFERGAAQIPWLDEIVRATRGVRSPRYATLWEACVNAIVFQAVSLFAATAVLRRVIFALSPPLAFRGVTVYAFPTAAQFLAGNDVEYRRAGLSFAKIAALRTVASAIVEGRLDETMLEVRTTPDASALLCTLKGIGPWTAAVILLRGLGRLDLFPMNDSGVARIVRQLGDARVDLAEILRRLGDERGMLYYYLLLGRLIAAGEIDPSAKPLEINAVDW